MYNPIDGQLGENLRIGYGIAFGGQAANNNIKFVNDVESAQTGKVVAAAGTGFKTFTATVDDKFATVSTGKILEATGGSFNYSPSSAFKLVLTLRGIATKAALYNVIGADAGTVSLINWNNAKERPGLTPNEYCGAGGTNPYYGVAGEKLDSLKAAFFVPASQNYVLKVWCAKESATLAATEQDIGQAERSSAQTISAAVNKTESANLPQRASSVYYLKQYIVAVGKSLVCISSSQDSLKLSWNSKEIVGETAAPQAGEAPKP